MATTHLKHSRDLVETEVLCFRTRISIVHNSKLDFSWKQSLYKWKGLTRGQILILSIPTEIKQKLIC